jgi:hypothetical protein
MGLILGEVYRPEDVTSLRDVQARDLTPSSLSPSQVNLRTILREIEDMKKAITQIKQALQSHGITVE